MREVCVGMRAMRGYKGNEGYTMRGYKGNEGYMVGIKGMRAMRGYKGNEGYMAGIKGMRDMAGFMQSYLIIHLFGSRCRR